MQIIVINGFFSSFFCCLKYNITVDVLVVMVIDCTRRLPFIRCACTLAAAAAVAAVAAAAVPVGQPRSRLQTTTGRRPSARPPPVMVTRSANSWPGAARRPSGG